MKLQTALAFVADLKLNNNREWFTENKSRYLEAKAEFEAALEELIPMLKSFDNSIDITSANDCLFRIYRDVRFSKNKEPYKPHFGAFIARGGRKSKYAGYYLHLEAGGSFLGGGIYMPEPKVLKAIRTDIYQNPEEFLQILNDKGFSKYYPEIYGEKLKLAPKGFPYDFEHVDLLKHKHYALAHSVSDNFWKEEKLANRMVELFKAQYAFNRFLNYAVENRTD